MSAAHMQGSSTDLTFGAVTVVTGIVGALSGGFLLDKVGSSMRNANTQCGIAAICGCVFMLMAFLTAPGISSFLVGGCVGHTVGSVTLPCVCVCVCVCHRGAVGRKDWCCCFAAVIGATTGDRSHGGGGRQWVAMDGSGLLLRFRYAHDW